MVADDLERQLANASEGDPVALDQLLQAHLSALFGYIRPRLDPVIRAHESCADVVQSVCREVLERQIHFDYRGLPSFRKWLFEAVRHKLIDKKRYYEALKRTGKREVDISDISHLSAIEKIYSPFYSPSQAASFKEDAESLEAALAKLPEDHRQVIHLSRYVGMDQAEIAEQMGRSVPAVRTLLHRALSRLGLLMHRAKQSDDMTAGP